LGVVTGDETGLSVADFHAAFLVMALIALLSLPGFLRLRPEDGAVVSGHRRVSAGSPSDEQ